MIVIMRQATVASGAKLAEALQFAGEVTEHVKTVLPDSASRYFLQIGGAFATIHWSLEFPDMAGYERAFETLMTDEAYLKMVADSSDCWLAGSVVDTLLRGL